MTISERLIVFSNNKIVEMEHDVEELHIQTADIYSHTDEGERVYGTKYFSSNPFQVKLTWSNLIFNEILASTLPKDVLIEAVKSEAPRIILAHNHPSGDVNPSIEDKRFTKALVDIGHVQNIPILDHIIIGEDNYFSFMENNLI